MNRARKTGKGLPRRVYIKHGAYHFVSPEPIPDPKDGTPRKWIRLGSVADGEPAMLQVLGQLLQDKKSIAGSMPDVCNQFKLIKLGRYSTETQATYRNYLDTIATAFEDFSAAQVTTKSWAEFLRDNFADKQNTAQKYTALARRLFKFIISELGLRQDNPIDQIDLSGYQTTRREVLPTHDQVKRIRAAGMMSMPNKNTGKSFAIASGPMFGCLVDIAYLLWQRAIDVRTLKEQQIDGDYIRFKPSKTMKSSGKTVDIFITPQIAEVLDRAREIKKEYKVKGQPLITPYLFPTRDGKPYTKSGLFSMWDRARDRIGIDKDSSPDERIQFRDLRALGATDAAKAGENMKAIQTRLAHTSGKTSEIYIKESVPERSAIDLPLPWLDSKKTV
ncbi:tyrosine-type recombinase/integrase [Herminiimonas contaminans]|uniref:Tyrosine-type recombinase/integrase n=1 Tax=Herminiimonas contaminans TaxID=1111140 RepID=A0ABS0ET39_9BURK|nr:tyrosine-type recombinase/integrase [Herminiimonas contaminans]MBF8177209.1 tyrosine-type recombinase/integrase [Herminiimonas contaminans]